MSPFAAAEADLDLRGKEVSAPIQALRNLEARVRHFALAAVQVERAMGFPAEVSLAAWSQSTTWGRFERGWLLDTSLLNACLAHANAMAASVPAGIAGVQEICQALEVSRPGIGEIAMSAQVRLACDRARTE